MIPAAALSRPRVEGDRVTEIYAVVVQLLVAQGYDKLTFDQVALQARAGKATLYRKWPTKAALVVDAVQATLCPDAVDTPDTGTLRGDLVSAGCQEGGLTSGLPELIGAVMPALHRDEELMRELRVRLLDPMAEGVVEVFRRAQRRGEIGPGADLGRLAAILPAMCLYQALIDRAACGSVDVVTIVDEVVLPACRATVA
ncbi:TetR/AcrR family transcriptional regulator [Cellulomonas hominis]